MKYRKKPVVIEAFRWTGGPDQAEDPEWICNAIRDKTVYFEHVGLPDVTLRIITLEGVMMANQGDWIIKGVKGELYPCKPDVFEATYTLADDPAPASPLLPGLEREVTLRMSFIEWMCGEREHPDTGAWFDRPEGAGEFWWRKAIRAEISRLNGEGSKS